MNKLLAVILVNWNGENYIKECLDSILTQSIKNFDTYFIDNKSSDKSLEIAKSYKNINIIESKINLGFAGGNNLALQQILELDYEYVALINPDTVLTKTALQELIDTISRDKQIGAAQSKLLVYNTDTINTLGNDMHFLGFSYCGCYGESNYPIETHEITIASGAAIMLRVSALKDTGLLDEMFFMYQEDTDLSWRLWEAGYKIVISGNSTIYHKYNFSRNKNKFYYFERNRLIILLKNYELKTLLLLSPAILVTEILMIIYSLVGGWAILKLRGYLDIIKLWPKIMRNRRQILKNKKVFDSELKQKWTTDLHFEKVTNPLFIPLNLFFKAYWFLFGWLI